MESSIFEFYNDISFNWNFEKNKKQTNLGKGKCGGEKDQDQWASFLTSTPLQQASSQDAIDNQNACSSQLFAQPYQGTHQKHLWSSKDSWGIPSKNKKKTKKKEIPY